MVMVVSQVVYAVTWLLHRLDALAKRYLDLDWFEPSTSFAQLVLLARHHTFSHERATQDFGYQPRVPLEEGLYVTLCGPL